MPQGQICVVLARDVQNVCKHNAIYRYCSDNAPMTQTAEQEVLWLVCQRSGFDPRSRRKKEIYYYCYCCYYYYLLLLCMILCTPHL